VRKSLPWPARIRSLGSRKSPSTTSPRTAGSSSPARCSFSALLPSSAPLCGGIGFWITVGMPLVVSCTIQFCEIVWCSCCFVSSLFAKVLRSKESLRRYLFDDKVLDKVLWRIIDGRLGFLQQQN
jgi:hypothetical protein